MKEPRPLVIEVHDRHVDIIVNGKILAHSEDYASEAGARRAARTLIYAINHRPTRLVEWVGRIGEQIRIDKRVRKLWASPGVAPVALPVEYKGSNIYGIFRFDDDD